MHTKHKPKLDMVLLEQRFKPKQPDATVQLIPVVDSFKTFVSEAMAREAFTYYRNSILGTSTKLASDQGRDT